MWLPLVVGVDGSPSSLSALDWAVDEAARLSLPLHLVHASMGPEDDVVLGTPEAARGKADALLASAVESAHLRNPDVKVTVEVVDAAPVRALLEGSHNASALVVGARGHGGLEALLLGSVSLAVAGRALCPVVVVRDGTSAPPEGVPHRILLGVEDAASSSAAVEFAFQMAEVRGQGVDAVTAWCCPALTSAAGPGRDAQLARHAETQLDEALHRSESKHPMVDVRRTVARGSARDILLRSSATTDLLVVGARRRRGRVGILLGKVNHAVLHYATCTVALVPQWETPEKL
ncbi:universal stress protein [Streptomyces finlayi]|uniref:Universal stress protein n=1 Tax=Streptomyces finlayi TaxID=67296 RepID=A0A7G7BUI2_9ACTN|nr:universal stress protein [Streptomyces finlayi]